MMAGDAPPRTPLRELALLFLKLGVIGFGGPAAHIAMMEDEVVRRRGWLSHEEFLDYIGAANLIPGPNSTEIAIHIGYARAGWAGLVIAGTCFILPAAFIVTAIAWVYVRFGSLPAVASVLYGVKPVVIAVVAQALWGLGRSALKTWGLALLGAAAVAAVYAGMNELLILACAGAVVGIARASGRASARSASVVIAPTKAALWQAAIPTATAGAASTVGFGLFPLFAVFLKIGAVLFGSGYVLLAFMRADLVERLHWLTERQLLDAIAVGQITPGPVFTTATFVGYVLGGSAGAAVATIGIFLPAFVFVAMSGLLIPYIRRSAIARGTLDGVNVASLALMAVVTLQLARTALVDPVTIAIGLVAAVLLLRYRLNSAWLVLGGAMVGIAASQVR